MVSLKPVECLNDYINYILNLDPIKYNTNMINMLDEENYLVGCSNEDKEELSKRKSFVFYSEFLNKLRLEQLNTNIDLAAANKHKTVPETKFYFRGQYDSGKGLRTGVYRKETYKYEDSLYHEMLVRCAEEFKNTSHISKLTKMQHYGSPTRLLDITSNPLVALYFACKNYGCEKCEYIEEGIVYIFSVNAKNMVYSDSDRALILSSLPRFSYDDKLKMLGIATNNLTNGLFQIKKDGSYKDNVIERLYHEICLEVPAFKRELLPIDLLQPIFIQPDKTNRRILRQDGAFILDGLSQDGIEEQGKLERLSAIKLRIKNKDRILEELNRFGINEATLFPEMEHVANYLKDSIS